MTKNFHPFHVNWNKKDNVWKAWCSICKIFTEGDTPSKALSELIDAHSMKGLVAFPKWENMLQTK